MVHSASSRDEKQPPKPCGETGKGAAPRNGAGDCVVMLWDDNVARRGQVAEIVARCGARLFEPGAEVSSPSRDSVRIVLVAVLGSSGVLLQDAERLQRASVLGLKVLAYGDGISAWSVTDQCRALLLGACVLLDSARPDFDARLVRELGSVLGELTAARAERAKLKARFADLGLVAESRSMLRLFRLILRLAQLSDLPVLISGESGTGKELVARAIHRLDARRAGGPFIAVNCAAISAGLAESELFGHRRGAFTGAERERKGLLRAAGGGVLFLDEISEMSLELQAKLLRVLQEGRVISVGDEREEALNARVLAASNRDLSAMVSDGRFRSDLFHRLNVIPVRVPAVRDRPEDIEPLVRHFIQKHQSLTAEPCVATGEFSEALRRIDLPGNARQLENIVRQALVRRIAGEPLGLRDLSTDVWQQVCACESQRETKPHEADARPGLIGILSSNGWNLSKSLGHCEREMIRAALTRSNGNQSRAAHLLGITPRSIYNKLHRPS